MTFDFSSKSSLLWLVMFQKYSTKMSNMFVAISNSSLLLSELTLGIIFFAQIIFQWHFPWILRIQYVLKTRKCRSIRESAPRCTTTSQITTLARKLAKGSNLSTFSGYPIASTHLKGRKRFILPFVKCRPCASYVSYFVLCA